MDALGDYIYIIALVAIVIVNILKKARTQAPASAPSPALGEEMEEMERKRREIFSPFPPLSSPPSTPKPYPSEQQTVDTRPKKTPPQVVIEPKKKPLGDVEVKETHPENAFSISFKNADDARKAFLYSEIWGRKY